MKNPYEVPPGHKGVWLDEKTFVLVKADADEAELRAKFENRKGPGWDLGAVEQFHGSLDKPRVRIRRAN